MVLYGVAGRALPISSSEWIGALSTALRFGWKPAGTLPPPIAMETGFVAQWDGSYEKPLGQAVARQDAAALATSLAAAAINQAGAAFEPLIALCRRSGFVVCEEHCPSQVWPAVPASTSRGTAAAC